MKYIGANVFLGGRNNEIVKAYLNAERNHHSQFRIVCKARGVNHANEIVSQLLGRNVFQRGYAAETENKEELSHFSDPSVKFIIYWLTANKAITNVELERLLERSINE